ncbi:MAG: hypothetical protein HY790_12840 [Deltaproteobacteria bacterium]|nr:hypothetical protein [Deltaproteobacteria bacterium]MBI4796700.1 hypothetical protein [Deltaproteobacteria bacterium]
MDELHPSSANQARAAAPDFEILAPAGGGLPFHLPMSVKSLSAGGVILEVTYPPDGLNLRELQGRGVVINLPAAAKGLGMAIQGKVLWTRPQGGDNPQFLLGLELEDPSLEVRQALEDQLHIVTKDIKELWDHWDRLQEKVPLVPSSSQAIYVVGLGVVLGGAALQIWGPDDLKSFGFILVLYGCATLAVKSIWSLWRQRVNPKSQEPMATNR